MISTAPFSHDTIMATTRGEMMAHRVLLDTSSLMYRAYFGLPTSIKDDAGRPVNAVHGYLDMTTRLMGSRGPDLVTHVYDDVYVPEPRAKAYRPYKMHRPPDPEGLPEQFGLLDEVLSAFGVERASAPGWEADDAIASLCAQAGAGDLVEIVTGDRDLLQLVRDQQPTVRLLFTVKGVSDLATFDEAAVLARYGVPPSRYVDFATLRGDPSDGLPGVTGIGEKTASRLFSSYPSLDALLADADNLAPKLAARLRESTAYLAAMREVVPTRSDVEVTIQHGEPDLERLATLGRTRRLGGPIRRLADALGLPNPFPE
jgi:5'-3' exonuclease